MRTCRRGNDRLAAIALGRSDIGTSRYLSNGGKLLTRLKPGEISIVGRGIPFMFLERSLTGGATRMMMVSETLWIALGEGALANKNGHQN